MKLPTHWTISRWKDYAECPKKYEGRYILGMQSPAHPAAARGTDIHETIEHYLKGERGDVHREVSFSWFLQIVELKELGAVAEEAWEFSAGWHPVDKKHPLWVRSKIDTHYFETPTTLHIIDYKTGRIYASNVDQLDVYALMGFAKFDKVETIKGSLWYLDHGEPHDKTYSREDAERLSRRWDQRADELLGATRFPAKPNKFCKWCVRYSTCAEGQASTGSKR